MLQTLSTLKACQDISSGRELARKYILKLRWIGQDETTAKLSEEVACFIPNFAAAGPTKPIEKACISPLMAEWANAEATCFASSPPAWNNRAEQ